MKWAGFQRRDGRRVNEVSVLALAETLGSTALALWLAALWETLAWFALSAFVAPFLLLRTRDSTAHGIRLARRYVWWDKYVVGTRPLAALTSLVCVLAPFVIRFWAILSSLIRSPGACVAALPQNWWRAIAVADSTLRPEPVPGYRCLYVAGAPTAEGAYWDLANFLQRVKDNGLFGYLATPVLSVLFFLPAAVYRLNIKSTWWIYLPLLWAASPVGYEREMVWGRIRDVVKDRKALVLSGLVLAFVLCKVIIWQRRDLISDFVDGSSDAFASYLQMLVEFFGDYIAPESLPMWQIASLINALLAIAMFVTAKLALRARDENRSWPERDVDLGFRWGIAIRRLLSSYSIIVMLLITFRLGFPPLGEWLPAWLLK